MYDSTDVQIRPLVKPTNAITGLGDVHYSWHDLVSKGELDFRCL